MIGQLAHGMNLGAAFAHRVVGAHVPKAGWHGAEKTVLLHRFQAHAPLTQFFDVFMFNGNQRVSPILPGASSDLGTLVEFIPLLHAHLTRGLVRLEGKLARAGLAAVHEQPRITPRLLGDLRKLLAVAATGGSR